MNRILVLLISLTTLVLTTQNCAGQKRKKTQVTVPGVYKIDSDGDGVPDVRDQCPDTPRNIKVNEFGCPFDTDGDGIYDYEDDCPNQPGPRENKGCPYGDRDGDGITDDKDKCPDVPGVIEYQGCPPPDRDGDGVLDSDDLCPDVPGTKANKGCPEIINKEEEAILEQASKVEFAFSKWDILPKWYSTLDKVVGIMRKYPKASLLLEGHTDSVGEDDANQTLSENRAAAVREYLISKGIDPFRIESKGFGESQPIDTNDTDTGRQRNRRVKMTVYTKAN